MYSRMLFDVSLIHFVVSLLSQLKHILSLADQRAHAATFEMVMGGWVSDFFNATAKNSQNLIITSTKKGHLAERPGRVEIKDTGYKKSSQSMLHVGRRHLSMFSSSHRGISLEVLVRVLPFRRVKVPVIVSSLLRQRLGNNFAAQEEGKSQF